MGDALPHVEEYGLEFGHGRALHAHVHVAPLAHHVGTRDVIVGHVHAAHVGHPPVNHHNLAVVTREHMIDVGETYRVKTVYLDAQPPQLVQMMLLERLVVGHVSEIIKQGAHLNPLFCLHGQEVKQRIGNRVVTEVEVLQMDMMPRAPHLGKQVFKLLAPALEQLHLVAIGHLHSRLLQVVFHYRIAARLADAHTRPHQQTQHYPYD